MKPVRRLLMQVAFFSAPVMRVGKAPIARCADRDRFATLAEIVVFPDNTRIFDELVAGRADLP